MAVLHLPSLVLSDPYDASDAQDFLTMNSLKATTETSVEVRRYANGRTRLVTRAGQPQSMQVSLPLLTRTQVRWLTERAGKVLLVRDPTGRRFYGVFSTPTFDERVWDETADTALTFLEVTLADVVA